jgi:GNAT superfamily N-acetyltransferase
LSESADRAVAVPRDDQGWLELILGGMPPFWSQVAESSGGSVWRGDGVVGAVVPKSPERSIFNSVFYEHGPRLVESLDPLAAAYRDAGVNAWTVWAPEGDRRTVEALEQAGHALDAEPRAMAMEISEMQAPEPDGSIEIRQDPDMAELARLNEIAYGWPPGDFSAVASASIPRSHLYFASLDGETVASTVAWDHGDDCEINWVATLPEARGRGIATQLMVRAIADAGERGRLTTTLVATKLGRPVYERLGYRDFGAIQMWERREG